eukprot:gene2946-12953_t
MSNIEKNQAGPKRGVRLKLLWHPRGVAATLLSPRLKGRRVASCKSAGSAQMRFALAVANEALLRGAVGVDWVCLWQIG